MAKSFVSLPTPSAPTASSIVSSGLVTVPLLSDPVPDAVIAPRDEMKSLAPVGGVPAELHTHFMAASAELKKMGAAKLGGKFQVALALDISNSMQTENKFFYNAEGECDKERYPLQELINQALAFGYLLDEDSYVTLFPFGDQAYGPDPLDEKSYGSITNHFFDEEKGVNNLKDHTDYTAVVNAITHHYTNGKTPEQIRSIDPVFVIFITDGEINPALRDTEIVHRVHDKKPEFQPYPYAAPRPKNLTAALEEVQAAFTKTAGLPFYFLLIGFEGEALKHVPKADQFRILKQAAEYYKTDEGRIAQNIDLVLLDHPKELDMGHFVRKLPHWLIQAHNLEITAHNVHKLVDMDVFNRYQRSLDPWCARLFSCCRPDPYQLVHHDHHKEEHKEHKRTYGSTHSS